VRGGARAPLHPLQHPQRREGDQNCAPAPGAARAQARRALSGRAPRAQCPKDRWQGCARCQARLAEQGLADEFALQSWFVGRVNAFLRARGRHLVGWDEILEGGLSPGAVVMSWRARRPAARRRLPPRQHNASWRRTGRTWACWLFE